MATYYAITPAEEPPPPEGRQRTIIRSGKLAEMLWYVDREPSAWRLWRITRRGHWHELDVAESATVAAAQR